MERQSYANVWDALENTPAEAANMTMRSNLLIAIERRVRGWNITQAEAAQRLGVTRIRISRTPEPTLAMDFQSLGSRSLPD